MWFRNRRETKMSDAAHSLIDAFTALPAIERHAVLLELARISEEDTGEVSDDELAFAGEHVVIVALGDKPCSRQDYGIKICGKASCPQSQIFNRPALAIT